MNRFESAALDRWITGNYGEDFLRDESDEDEVEMSPEDQAAEAAAIAAHEAWERGE